MQAAGTVKRTTLARPDVSGTTAMLPEKTTLSPALATSQVSLRQITSMQRGMEPGGISSAFSWTRRRCQSTKALLASARRKLLSEQVGLGHTCGSEAQLSQCGAISAVKEASKYLCIDTAAPPKYLFGSTSRSRTLHRVARGEPLTT